MSEREWEKRCVRAGKIERREVCERGKDRERRKGRKWGEGKVRMGLKGG